ncbi:MAG: sugar phosphate isomerase/epimerase family protein [Puniceicoccaceae bacterium]
MKPQSPEWLGLICQGQSFEEVGNWLEAAAEYGFKTVQPVFFWDGYSAGDFERLAAKLKELGLSAPVFGVYSDLYKWDQPVGAIFESTIEDLKVAAANAATIGAENLVTWCGTVGGFAEAHPDNRSPEALATFKRHQERILPVLQEAGVALLFEPWRDHILGDEILTAKACQVDPGHFKAVLDFPNFISPDQWPDKGNRIEAIATTLAPHIGVVHLKDMLVNEKGEVELPMFGRGELTRELARAIKPFAGQKTIIAEHLGSPDDIPELIESVSRHF